MRIGIAPRDELLTSHRFENIHREADRSTRYYLNKCDSLESWLVACRYNRPSTLELCVFHEDGSLSEAESIRRVRLAEQSGLAINTSVYTASFWKKKQGQSWEDIQWISEIAPFVDQIAKQSDKLSEFISRLREIPRIGTFMSIQWGLNLSYFYTHLVIDEVPFNNGARQGLNLLGYDAKSILKMDFIQECVMTVISLEHALCAYQKYTKLRDNPRVLHKYKPSTSPLLPIKLPSNWITHYGGLLDSLHELDQCERGVYNAGLLS